MGLFAVCRGVDEKQTAAASAMRITNDGDDAAK